MIYRKNKPLTLENAIRNAEELKAYFMEENGGELFPYHEDLFKGLFKYMKAQTPKGVKRGTHFYVDLIALFSGVKYKATGQHHWKLKETDTVLCKYTSRKYPKFNNAWVIGKGASEYRPAKHTPILIPISHH